MTNPNMSPVAGTVSWDDTSINANSGGASRKMERFKAEQGKTHRLLILDQPTQVWQHYKKDFGYVRCLKSVSQRCAFCDGGDKPSHKLGVNVLMYPGNPADAKGLTPDNTKVMTWLFGPKTFAELRNIKGEWGPLNTYDLKIGCTNAQFQHLTITPCREALWTQSPQAQQIAESIKESIYDLPKILSRTLSEAEVAGVWAGTLGRDDIFKKRDDAQGTQGAPAGGVMNYAPPTASAAPAPQAPPPGLPASLDMNALLGRTAG